MKKPSKVISELKRIAAENGGILQPEIVVQRARSRTSPLHSRFTWDDGKAAHEFRLWQARQLISVSVEMIEGISGPVDVFVSLSGDRKRDGGGYRVLTTVLTDSQLRQQMLIDAMNELSVFREKYSRLRELAEIFKSIRKVRKKIKA